MNKSMQPWIVLAAMVAVVAGSTQVEGAFLTADNPDVTVVRPLSGSITYTFTGSVSFDAGYTADASGGSALFLAGTSGSLPGPFLGIGSNDPSILDLGAASNGGTYTGPIISYVIGASQALGSYNTGYNGNSPVTFYAANGSGQTEIVSTNLSITVVSAASVPEPASLMLTSIGLVGINRRCCMGRARAKGKNKGEMA